MNKLDAFSKMNDLIFYTGDELLNKVEKYKSFTPRILLDEIIEYLNNKDEERVLELFGLRRTGKTVLMLQAISYLINNKIEPSKIIYIDCINNNSIYQVINLLKGSNFEYVFIDEASYLVDFVEGSSGLCNMLFKTKCVLVGTDSLTFILSSSNMYDRFVRLSTTFISYKDWYKINNGKTSIFDYVHKGGILGSYKDCNTYINESINNNIKNSLANGLLYCNNIIYENIKNLIDCYPSIVIKVTENFSNRFSKRLIKSKFETSMSLGFNKNTLILDSDSKHEMNKLLSDEFNLDFKDMDIDKRDLEDIEDVLNSLDFYKNFIVKISDFDKVKTIRKNLQVQPTIRYNQYLQLLNTLDDKLNLFDVDREDFNKEFTPSLEGQLIEQIVQLHVMYKLKDKYDLYTYQNSVLGAEIDLVMRNKYKNECYLIEIKRSNTRRKEHRRWISNEKVIEDLRKNFGIKDITKKIILYNGESEELTDLKIEYVNIENFLLNL